MNPMQTRTALINLPFGFHLYPSIQLGTLSTLLKAHGWEVKSYYLNLHFAHQLGLDRYKRLCEERFLIGEWLFSHLLFGDSPQNQEYSSHFRSHMDNIQQTLGVFDYQKVARLEAEFLDDEELERKYGAGPRSYVVTSEDNRR